MASGHTEVRPHVAFFLPHLGGGGAEKMNARLANGLSACGYRVDMVLVRAAGVYREMLSEDVQVFDLHARDSYLALPGLVRYLRRRRPLVLVASLPLTSLIALIARWLAGSHVRIAIRIENTVSAQQRTPWKKALERPLLAWLFPFADRILPVSKAVAEDLEHYLRIRASRLHVIYNPAATVRSSADAHAAPVHPWLAEAGPPVVLGVGRLTPAKDFATLIKAFAAVRRQRPARLIILGEGGQREHLLSLAHQLGIAEDVSLPGFSTDVFRFLQGCSVFVLSSIYEGLPTVLIEALESGCPVISTDCPGGSREILKDGAYGEIVPVGDVQAMTAAINTILNGQRRYVDPGWLEQFQLPGILSQMIGVLGLPLDPA